VSDLDFPAKIIERLRTARSITALTGGGLAQECGVLSFREAQLRDSRWADYAPQELATVEAFVRNPRLVWEWFAYRRELLANIQPGPAHYALVDLEQLTPKFMLITQAIDGLHWQAGSRAMIELHGCISRMRSFDDGGLVDTWDEREIPPRCPRTGGYLRPDVVLYGEGVPRERVREADAATRCDVFICVGTDSVVQPAVSLPLHAKRQGALVIEINRKPSTFSFFADHIIHGSPTELLPRLVELVASQG
jgi:NAD-dependent deacetylase